MTTHVSARSRTSTALLTGLALLGMFTAACGGSTKHAGSSQSTSTTSVAGASTAASDANLIVHGVIANTSDPFWETVACATEKEAKARGIHFKWYSSETNEATQLNTNFNSALLGNPVGLLVDAPSVDQFVGPVRTLMQRGVPVATSLPMKPPPYISVLPQQVPPPAMIRLTTSVLKTGGSVLTLGGSAAVPVVKTRYTPLINALKTQQGVKILPVQYDDFDPNKTQTLVSSAILKNRDLKLIIASTGPEGQGAVAALRESGRKDIKIVAFDAVPAEVAALKDGTILALAAQPAGPYGKLQIDAVVDYLETHRGSKSAVVPMANPPVLNLALLTKDNLTDPAMAGYIYHSTCAA